MYKEADGGGAHSKICEETVFEYAETFTVGKLPTPTTLFKRYPDSVGHRSVIILFAGYPRRRADFRPMGPLQFFWRIGAVRGGFFGGVLCVCAGGVGRVVGGVGGSASVFPPFADGFQTSAKTLCGYKAD